ncbi:adenosine kinase [Sphingomicrobium arenosum]|uniref:adenosine kinase n=1 Tax=Sphingomicrobium arenosum TaxID=2233861 RepID=UPI002240FA4F|nr:adenosine kinase [Sphingomicrobium arenosum]
MTQPRLDVLAIGNAIVDVIADASDEFLDQQDLDKGGMRLIDEAEAERLYGLMGAGREISGGSAGNTAAGIAALGVKAGFIGQVADDQLGQIYKHDIEAAGVDFIVPPSSEVDAATARCLILVTPDAQRTMNTFLGAAQELPAGAISDEAVADASILYLEGYLWDPPGPRAAMEKAIDAARAAGRKVAFTLSDTFCISRHRGDFVRLLDEGKIDVLFSNEEEAKALADKSDLDEAVEWIAPKVPLLVVTRSEKGAIAVEDGHRARVGAQPIKALVDTTGAGDLFAAGFLAGLAQERDLEACLKMGAIAAAEVIQHYGARPEEDLRALVAKKLA